MIFLAEIELNP